MIFESHMVELKELTDLQSIAKAPLTNWLKLYFYTLAVHSTSLKCDILAVLFLPFCEPSNMSFCDLVWLTLACLEALAIGLCYT